MVVGFRFLVVMPKSGACFHLFSSCDVGKLVPELLGATTVNDNFFLPAFLLKNPFSPIVHSGPALRPRSLHQRRDDDGTSRYHSALRPQLCQNVLEQFERL